MYKCDRRQTDHAAEKCVAIGGIACTTAIPHNNVHLLFVVWSSSNIAACTNEATEYSLLLLLLLQVQIQVQRYRYCNLT